MKSKPVVIEFIENSGPDNLRDTLKNLLSQTRINEVCIAVAFSTQSGLNEIIQPLRQVAARGTVRLITGLYQQVTEPQALETLLSIQNETRCSFWAKLSTEPQFHRKFYILKSKSETTAIIGSSNLTKEGLESGGEINVILSSEGHTSSIQELKNIFEKEWDHRAITLSASQIKGYGDARTKTRPVSSFSRSQIKKILGTELTHARANPPLNKIDFWRDCVTGYLKKRTDQILTETTNWDKRNYSWFGAGGRHNYHIKDRIFLFDMNDNKLRLVEVTDIAHTKISTPDGRNFIAYKHVRGYGKKLTKNLWQLLEEEGIKNNSANRRVLLTMESVKILLSLIKTKSA